ncbi:UNVERIFIED_CONTAM: hypothetical protein Slati_1108100 [Sesamum latifolium]|uniref:Uncharacterized protein n=1 Tax=Sesamum latifolium TaxID=2727402 RepID=A0AAW2XB09_9LAMI
MGLKLVKSCGRSRWKGDENVWKRMRKVGKRSWRSGWSSHRWRWRDSGAAARKAEIGVWWGSASRA